MFPWLLQKRYSAKITSLNFVLTLQRYQQYTCWLLKTSSPYTNEVLALAWKTLLLSTHLCWAVSAWTICLNENQSGRAATGECLHSFSSNCSPIVQQKTAHWCHSPETRIDRQTWIWYKTGQGTEKQNDTVSHSELIYVDEPLRIYPGFSRHIRWLLQLNPIRRPSLMSYFSDDGFDSKVRAIEPAPSSFQT